MTQTQPEPEQQTADLLDPSKGASPKNASPQSVEVVEVAGPETGVLIDLDLVDEDPANARKVFDEAKLAALGADLKLRQVDDLHVVPDGERFRLFDGARRLRSGHLAGLRTLRFTIWRGMTLEEAAKAAAATALHKEGLNPYEQGRLFQRLLDLGMTKKKLCQQYDINFRTLQDRLDLLDLPEEVGLLVGRGDFAIGHAKALLPLKDHAALLESATAHFLALLKAEDLPTAENAPLEVAQALSQAGLVRETTLDTIGSLRYEVPDFEKQLKDLAHVDLELANGHTRVLYTDPAAFDAHLKQIHDRRAEELKAEKARERKKSEQDQKKADKQASKAAQSTHDRAESQVREEERQELILQHVEALQREAIPAHLAKKDKLATAAWVILAETAAALSTPRIEEYARVAGLTVGLKANAADDLLRQMDSEMLDLKAPKWFASLAAPKQLTFIVAFHAAHVAHDAELSKALTGHDLDHYMAKAEKAVAQLEQITADCGHCGWSEMFPKDAQEKATAALDQHAFTCKSPAGRKYWADRRAAVQAAKGKTTPEEGKANRAANLARKAALPSLCRYGGCNERFSATDERDEHEAVCDFRSGGHVKKKAAQTKLAKPGKKTAKKAA